MTRRWYVIAFFHEFVSKEFYKYFVRFSSHKLVFRIKTVKTLKMLILRFDVICFFSVNGWNLKDCFIAVNNICFTGSEFSSAYNSPANLLRLH